MSLPSKLISLTLAIELINKIDAAANEEFNSRSEFIRQAIIDKLRIQTAEQPTTAQPLIVEDSVNVLMSDTKLDRMFEALRREKVRREITTHRAAELRRWRDSR